MMLSGYNLEVPKFSINTIRKSTLPDVIIMMEPQARQHLEQDMQ
jgi:hypothetical protein